MPARSAASPTGFRRRLRAERHGQRAALLGALFAVAPAVLNFGDAAFAASWTPTGSLHVARDGHSATLLPNGNVLVAGGEGSSGVTSSAQVFLTASGTWSTTGSLSVARSGHQAALLASGQVLAAGGCIASCTGGNTTSSEIYSPNSGKWSQTGAMKVARVLFAMVPLPNGLVLAVGGCTGQNSNGSTGVTSTAELYDPDIGVWRRTGSMKVARGALTATLLADGRVLVAGGETKTTGSTTAAEIYDPGTGLWSLTGKMNTGRVEHAGVVLANGKVLVSGGSSVSTDKTVALASAELFDPATGLWSLTGSMNSKRTGHSSTLLRSGLVLDAAGNDGNNELATAELYQP